MARHFPLLNVILFVLSLRRLFGLIVQLVLGSLLVLGLLIVVTTAAILLAIVYPTVLIVIIRVLLLLLMIVSLLMKLILLWPIVDSLEAT